LLHLSAAEGRLLAFAGFALALSLLALGLWRRDAVLAVITLVVVFQAAINTFSYYLPAYSSNVVLFTIVLVGVAFAELEGGSAN
jgi:hypothetical protein